MVCLVLLVMFICVLLFGPVCSWAVGLFELHLRGDLMQVVGGLRCIGVVPDGLVV